MNFFVVLLPLLLMVTIVFLAIKYNRSNTNSVPRKTRLTSTFTKRLLSVYAVLLLGSTLAIVFTSSLTEESSIKIKDEVLTQYHDDIFINLLEGREEEVPTKHIRNEWSEKIDGDTFTLKGEEIYDFPVVFIIKRVETTDKIVEATLYEGVYAVSNIQVPRYMENIQVDWQNDQLSLEASDQKPIDLSIFQYDFTFTQFTDYENSQNRGMYAAAQYPVMYLKVPKSLDFKLSNLDEIMINYVE